MKTFHTTTVKPGGGHPVSVQDPDGYLARAYEYKRWCVGPEGLRLVAPLDYAFLHSYPDHFKVTRAAFEMHWAVKRLTGK